MRFQKVDKNNVFPISHSAVINASVRKHDMALAFGTVKCGTIPGEIEKIARSYQFAQPLYLALLLQPGNSERADITGVYPRPQQGDSHRTPHLRKGLL
jgi:hypothetical protein